MVYLVSVYVNNQWIQLHCFRRTILLDSEMYLNSISASYIHIFKHHLEVPVGRLEASDNYVCPAQWFGWLLRRCSPSRSSYSINHNHRLLVILSSESLRYFYESSCRTKSSRGFCTIAAWIILSWIGLSQFWIQWALKAQWHFWGGPWPPFAGPYYATGYPWYTWVVDHCPAST